MKKLLVLMLVLGMASAANAMTLSLSADLGAGTVDIDCSDGYVAGDDLYMAIVGKTAEVTLSGGAIGGAAPAESAIFGYDAATYGFAAAGEEGMWGFLGDSGGAAVGPGKYLAGLNWSLVGGTSSAILRLVTSPDFVSFTEVATIEVPEPMTIALMGLGSLFLLRRRK